MSEKKGHHKN